MRQWELWGSAFFPSGNERARQLAIADGLSLDWTCWAEGHVSAMQQYYDHLGYGEYKPMLRKDGTPYPEDMLDWRCASCLTYFGPSRTCPSCGEVTDLDEPGEAPS